MSAFKEFLLTSSVTFVLAGGIQNFFLGSFDEFKKSVILGVIGGLFWLFCKPIQEEK